LIARGLLGSLPSSLSNDKHLSQMDSKLFLALAKRSSSSMVIAVALVVPVGIYLWNEYKDLVKQKDQLANDRRAFNDERSALEKARADGAILATERKAELEKREIALRELEKENQSMLAAVLQRRTEFSAAFDKLKQAQADVGLAQRAKLAEEKIERLMSEFSALRVNLNDTLKCNDAEGQGRYNAARAKYSEIAAIGEAYGLESRYKSFFFRNGQSVVSACEKG
jgi:hypothetical protein